MDTISISTRNKAKYTFNSLLPRTIENITLNNPNETNTPITVYCHQLNTKLNSNGVSPLLVIHRKGLSKINTTIPLGDIQHLTLQLEPSQEYPIDFSFHIS